jgi:hypothetical protein
MSGPAPHLQCAHVSSDDATRFRCAQCGNLTRFDVVETRRTRAYWHFSIEGQLSVEEEEVLSLDREKVTCRWCGSTDDVEEVKLDAPDG